MTPKNQLLYFDQEYMMDLLLGELLKFIFPGKNEKNLKNARKIITMLVKCKE